MDTEVQRHGNVAVVRVNGRIVRENQADLRAGLEGLLRDGVRHIALDLERVDYMDSAALGCCASVRKLMQETGAGSLVVFGASPNIRKMWKLIRLDLVVPIVEEEKDALDLFPAPTGGS